eukprot:544175-Hanusia_phi.AAC.2
MLFQPKAQDKHEQKELDEQVRVAGAGGRLAVSQSRQHHNPDPPPIKLLKPHVQTQADKENDKNPKVNPKINGQVNPNINGQVVDLRSPSPHVEFFRRSCREESSSSERRGRKSLSPPPCETNGLAVPSAP